MKKGLILLAVVAALVVIPSLVAPADFYDELKISRMKSKISSLEWDVRALQREISGLKSDVQRLQSELDDIRATNRQD